jgi:hypothetical protein
MDGPAVRGKNGDFIVVQLIQAEKRGNMKYYCPPPTIGAIVSLLVAISAPLVAGAQESSDSVRRELRLPQPATFAVAARGDFAAPGIAIGIPTGFGADYGDAFAAVGFQSRTRFRDAPDGGVVVGFGLGDATDLVGLEVAFTGFGTFRSCCRGGISPKLHRLLPGNSSIALGYENLVTWGEMEGGGEATDAGRSLYLAGTKAFRLRPDPSSFLGSGAITIGAGNGRFRRESDILADRERVNAFGGVALRVMDRASVIGSWTGQDLVAGLSIVPFRDIPLFITPGVADLTTTPRFILGLGYGFNYSSLF